MISRKNINKIIVVDKDGTEKEVNLKINKGKFKMEDIIKKPGGKQTPIIRKIIR